LSKENEISKDKKKALKIFGLTSTANFIGIGVSFFVSLVTNHILGPFGMGTLRIIKLIPDYIGYFYLGIFQSLIRQIPIKKAEGKNKECDLIRNSIFSFVLILSIILIGILWILFLSGVNFKNSLDLTSMVLLTLIIIVNRFNSLLHSNVKADGKFIILAKREIVIKVVPLITLPFIVLFKVKGALLSILTISLIGVLIYCIKYKTYFKFYLHLKKTFSLIKIGIKIFINKFANSIFWSIDITIIAFYLSVYEVGLYGFAVGVLRYAVDLSASLNMILYRRMLKDRGKHGLTNGVEYFHKYMEGPLVIYLLIASIILGFGFLGNYLLVRIFLLKFQNAIPCMIILIFGHMIFSTTYLINFYLNASDQLEKRAVVTILFIILNLLLDIILIRYGFGIIGAAIGSTISYFLFAGVLVIWSFKQIFGNFRYPIIYYGKHLLISIMLISMIYTFYNWDIISFQHMKSMPLKIFFGLCDAGLKGLIYCTLCLVLYSVFFRRHHVFPEIRNILTFIIHNIKLKVKKTEALSVTS